MLADTQTLRDLRNRIASFRDLHDSIAPELITEIALTHHGLLTSKLGKKASTNLGAIHAKLKKMLAEQMLDNAALKDLLSKKW